MELSIKCENARLTKDKTRLLGVKRSSFSLFHKKQEKNEGFLPTARPGLFKRWWGGDRGGVKIGEDMR